MRFEWLRSLRVQLFVLISIALLPLGFLAVSQTNEVVRNSQKSAELALLALTERASLDQRKLIERASAIARFVGSLSDDTLISPQVCTDILSRYTQDEDSFSFVGLIPLDGVMSCSSANGVFDLSDDPVFASGMANEAPTIVLRTAAEISGEAVLVVSEPFKRDGVFAGFVSVSIPLQNLPTSAGIEAQSGLVELLLLNREGAVLTSMTDPAMARIEAPSSGNLARLAGSEAQTFIAENNAGVERIYTLVPIDGSPLIKLGVWSTRSPLTTIIPNNFVGALFPWLMWIASLSVALLAVHKLVLRHLGQLRRAMVAFGESRDFDPDINSDGMPTELQDVYRNFATMAEGVLHDEATMEDLVRQKNILAKEVHHRTKNNLQLISSITGMQLRQSDNEDTQQALARLNDKVRGLATIHNNIYQTGYDARIDAEPVIAETLRQRFSTPKAIDADVTINQTLQSVSLYPEQLVPLTLLTSELLHIAEDVMTSLPDAGVLNLSLAQEDAECALTLTYPADPDGDHTPDKLSVTLIRGFTRELAAEVTSTTIGGLETRRVQFQVLTEHELGSDF